MNQFRIIVFLLILHSIEFSYQQDITNICPIGTELYNGACGRSLCPETHYLVNGACLLRPREPSSCGFGFDLINGICVQQNCPPRFVMINGLCQEIANHPATPIYCPNGFSQYNGMCLPNPGVISPPFCRPKPCRYPNCPFQCDENFTTKTTTSTPRTLFTTTTATTTTTTNPPEICPPEYVIINGECRFVSCLKGTFFKGRCIEPVCAHGLVWTGLRCAHPEVITTILEIENNFITETNQTGPDFHTSKSVDNIVFVNQTSPSDGGSRKNCTSSSNLSSSKKCCFVITPRMCRKFNSKWLCFNRQYRQCGDVCGNYSVIYLRVPKVTQHPGMLVIPPNPELPQCLGNECTKNDTVPVDCSGCLTNHKQTCSPYCYKYRCPVNRCTFIDRSEYCTKYIGSPGCGSVDGCFENYCYDEIANFRDDC